MIREHLQNLLANREIMDAATIRKFRIVQTEGSQERGRRKTADFCTARDEKTAEKGILDPILKALAEQFESGELVEKAVCRDFRPTAEDWKPIDVEKGYALCSLLIWKRWLWNQAAVQGC